MTRSNPLRAAARKHRDRQIEEVVHDPYLERAKPAEPAVCGRCGLVHHKGRWQRAALPAGAHLHDCPACRRIQDRNPAGYVTLHGARHPAVIALVRNEEAREAARHPLQRIMDVETNPDAVLVTTTDVHLARRIGDAVRAAFGGELDVLYSPDEYRVRVYWRA